MSDQKNFLSKIARKCDITKRKVLTSLLVGFSIPFLIFISASFNVYYDNCVELGFSFGDFAPTFLLLFAVTFAVITLVLLFTKKRLHNLLFALSSALIICYFVQTSITSLTFKGLPGDGNAPLPKQWWVIADLGIWVAVFAVVLWFCAISSKAKEANKTMSIILCLIMVTQCIGLLTSSITFALTSSDEDKSQMYLTNESLFEVSKNKNVIVFIVDRFDRDFYTELVESNPEIISELDGFTCYDDNISKYPRTYPSITYLLTGKENDFSKDSDEYFDDAYQNSTFFKDLKNNNFKINLFTPYYYSYTNADVLADTVSNVAVKEGHSIRSATKFTTDMLKLSSYFWLPDKFKSKTIYSNAFYEAVEFEGTAPEYSMDKSSDSQMYAEFDKTGLSVQSAQNTFAFIHMTGCHAPFTTDENGIFRGDGAVTSLQQTQGVFKFLTKYLQNLRNLGLYEDATIIITGDHGTLTSDSQEYTDPNLTTLLVKESGKAGTPLVTSQAPVSQDNLLASIVKYAGIDTETDYGRAFDEIGENEIVTRTHYFQKKNGAGTKDTNITYEITGSAKDFSNWKITDQKTNEYK